MITTQQDDQSARVRQNLKLILDSPEFATKPRLRKFLTYVVDHSLSGGTTLKGYHIAIDAFGRANDFDPNDPYIRNIARDVRKALTKLYSRAPKNLDLYIQIPKGSYQPQYSVYQPGTSVPQSDSYHGFEKVEVGSSKKTEVVAASSEPELLVVPSPAEIKFRPTVAVIPLRFQEGPERYQVVGEIIAENVITNLSRSPTIEVISRLTTTQFSTGDITLADIRNQLNTNYVVSGSYMVWNDTIRINVEIADADNNNALWADHLSFSTSNFLPDCENLASEIFSVLNATILEEQIRRSRYFPLETLDLHTLLISAIELMHRSSKSDFERSYNMLAMLQQKCPAHSLPNTYLAQWHIMATNREAGWAENSERKRRAAIEFCEIALTQDPRDSLALTIRGLIATNFEKQPENAKEYYDRAIALNPSNALAYCMRGALHGFMGNAGQALTDAERSIRLSPLDPQLYLFEAGLAAAAMAADDYVEAEKHALTSYSINTKHTSNLRALIAIEVELGQMEKAREFARKLMEIDPDFTTASYRKNGANSIYQIGEKISKSLRLAGIP